MKQWLNKEATWELPNCRQTRKLIERTFTSKDIEDVIFIGIEPLIPIRCLSLQWM